jgi:hypothetical protein
MGESVFASMFDNMINIPDGYPTANSKVGHAEYLAWQHGFVFEALQGLRYGQSFCNHFDITDNILFYEQDVGWADVYIRQNYLL